MVFVKERDWKMMYCINCKNMILKRDKFCSYCGDILYQTKSDKTIKMLIIYGIVSVLALIIIVTVLAVRYNDQISNLFISDSDPIDFSVKTDIEDEKSNNDDPFNTPAVPIHQDQITLDSMVVSSEIDGYIQGVNYDIVYRYVDASFHESAHVETGLISADGNFILDLQKREHDDSTGCLAYPLQAGHIVKHIGDDFFAVNNGGGVAIFNANTKTSFFIYHEQSNPEWGSFFTYDFSLYPIFDGFYNDVIICPGGSGQSYWVLVINKDGTSYITQVERTAYYTKHADFGIYSNDLFWFWGSFFDLEGNKVLDLSEYRVENIPMFYEGRAYIQITQNGKLWETEIDKQGNFLYELREC